MSGWTDGRTDGQMDDWIDGRTDGGMDRSFENLCIYVQVGGRTIE